MSFKLFKSIKSYASSLSPEEQISLVSVCQAVVSNFLILALVLLGGKLSVFMASVGFVSAVISALCYFFVSKPKVNSNL